MGWRYMDQNKIGKFIAERRKGLNMTQKDLAEKLGVTDRAVSKWETGRCMPDLSLLQPLSRNLKVGVNDLLSGEKVSEKELRKKSEENLVIMAKLNYLNSFRHGFWGFYLLGLALLIYCLLKKVESSDILALVFAYNTVIFYSRCRSGIFCQGYSRDGGKMPGILITLFSAAGTVMSLIAFLVRTW